MEAITINSFTPRDLGKGDCDRLIQVIFTVIKEMDFRDFGKWPLNRGLLNTGLTVCFSTLDTLARAFLHEL